MKKLILILFALASTLGIAQTTVAPITNPRVVFFNGSVACAGCLLDTFAAGTTNTLVTYSESTGTTPNANPVVLGSDGSAVVYLTSASYKFRLRTAAGATLWTQDQITWSTPLSTFAGLTDNGDFTQGQPTAATAGANQSSFSMKLQGKYWTGAASAIDQWTWQNVLGSGTNPTSTLTLSHSGSSGTVALSLPSVTFNNPTFSGTAAAANITASGTLGVTGTSTLGVVNAGATSVTSMVNTGDESLSTGKVIKWNSDVGISRTASSTLAIGNGTQGDITGNLKGNSLIGNSCCGTASSAIQAVNGTFPIIAWDNTAASSNFHWWDCGSPSSGLFTCSAVDDTNTGRNNWLTVSRGAVGTSSVSTITFGAGGFVQTVPQATTTLMGIDTTDAPKNKTLTGASTGNTVNLFSSGCPPQGPTASINGTGGAADIFTCALPVNVIENNKLLHVVCSGVHDTGTASVSMTMNINGQNIVTGNTGTTASQSWSMEVYVLRTGTTTGQAWGIAPVAAGNNGTMTAFSVGLTGLSWTSGTQTLNCQFTVAAGDHMTGRVWAPMSIQ